MLKTVKNRIIYLTDDLAAMVEARIKNYLTGPIFGTSRGSRWTREAVSVAMRWLSENKLKIE